jgi:hypothetical protein
MTYCFIIPLSKHFFCFIPSYFIRTSVEKDLAQLSYDELYNLCSDNDNDRAKQIEYANTYLMKAKGE